MNVSVPNSRRRSLQFGLLSLVLSFSAFPDHKEIPPPSTAPLKLRELIEEALEKNASLRATQQESVSREAEAGPAGAYEDPVVAFEAMNYPVNTLSSREFGMTGNQISLSQRFPFPGKLSRKRQSVEFSALAQKEIVETERLNLVRDVKLAYFELYSAFKKYDALNEQKSVLTQLVTVTRQRYTVGKIPQAEVLNLQVEQAGLMDQILTVERMIKHRLGELNHLLGRIDHAEYLYGRPVDLKKTSFDFTKIPEKALVETAIQKSPVIREKGAELSASEMKLSYSKWNYLPDFEFRVGYTQREQNAMDDGADFVSAMVGISIPLWAGSKQSEEKRGAMAQKMRAEALLDEERVRLAHKIHVLYAELEEADKRVRLFDGGVLPLTLQAVTASRSAYLTGKIEYSTLLSAINRRYQMETSYSEALALFESKMAELEATVGESMGVTP